ATERAPLRVLIDGRLRVPAEAPFFQAGPTLVATAQPVGGEVLQAQGHSLLRLPTTDGRVDLAELLRELARRGANDILVEAGASLAGALAQLGLVDEYLIFVAPKLLGSSARALLDWPLTSMAQAQDLQI